MILAPRDDDALFKILQGVVGGGEQSELVRSLAAWVGARLGGAAVGVWRTHQGELRFVGGAGVTPGFIGALDGADVTAEGDVIGLVAGREGNVVITDVAKANLAQAQAATGHGVRAVWGYSTDMGRTAGERLILAALFPEPRSPRPYQLRVLEESRVVLGVIEGQRAVGRELDRQARFDGLTGLPNRQELLVRLERMLSVVKRRGGGLAVLHLDLNNFRRINETMGHAGADQLLREVTKRLGAVGNRDTVLARVGGDEFLFVVPLADHRAADAFGLRALRALTQPLRGRDREVYLSACVGVSLAPADGRDADSLLRKAEAALTEAKRTGHAALRFYTKGWGRDAEAELTLEADLHEALRRNELVLHYQPRVDLRTGRVAGVEALLRWNHPRRGLLYPADFLEVAEQTGLIVDIGTWVLGEACRQLDHWNATGGAETADLSVSVNVAGKQLIHTDFAQLVVHTAGRSGVELSALEIEITEGIAFRDDDGTSGQLASLREVEGLRLAIDDFGTGLSSLARLASSPMDVLKIDRSFIAGLPNDPRARTRSRALVESVTALGRELGMRVVAEGIENESQLAIVRAVGCDEGQGFFLSRPQPGPPRLSPEAARILRAA